MNVEVLFQEIEQMGIDFYTGVPDSQLKAFCDTVMSRYGVGEHHVIAANEGAAVGLAAGHYLATGKPAVVYMQNSGIGNAVNPICSLLNEKVYAIPVLFIIGWRGEPGVHDEPQHIFQGEITIPLLDCLNIKSFIIDKATAEDDIREYFIQIQKELQIGHQCALVVKKGGLIANVKMNYANDHILSREQVVNIMADRTEEGDIFVSTTGKLSRELYEAREAKCQGHQRDFLTVGSMGHASMIAMGIARAKRGRRVFCLDGDGAVIMHMGSLAVTGCDGLDNLVHVLIDNGSHETVGGLPTVGQKINYLALAGACGYRTVYSVSNEAELTAALDSLGKALGAVFIVVKTDISSRADLGRPATTPIENKEAFMEYLK